MDKPSESKDFVVSLGHRIEHLNRRKERCELYSTMDQSKLDKEQLKAARNLDEVVGMIKEAKHTENAYRTFLVRKDEEQQQRLRAEYQRGRAEAQHAAHTEAQEGLTLLSGFLRLAAHQYAAGAAGNVTGGLGSAEVAAVVGALHLFYLGGPAGAEAMAKLVAGSDEAVGPSGVSYRQLQALVRGLAHPEQTPQLGAKPHHESAPTDPKAAPKTDAKINPKIDSKTDIKPDIKPDPKPDVKVDFKANNKVDTKADTKTEVKAEAKADPNGNKSDGKAEAKADTKAEVKADPNFDTNIPKTEGNPKTDMNTKPEEPKTDTYNKPDANKPEANNADVDKRRPVGAANGHVPSDDKRPTSYAAAVEMGPSGAFPSYAAASSSHAHGRAGTPVSSVKATEAGAEAPVVDEGSPRPSAPSAYPARPDEVPKRGKSPVRAPSPPSASADGGFQVVGRNDRHKKNRFKGKKPVSK